MNGHPPEKLRAQINGEQREVPRGQTLLQLVESLGLVPERLAIEYQRTILKPELWEKTEIADGAEIEIVHFVGGG